MGQVRHLFRLGSCWSRFTSVCRSRYSLAVESWVQRPVVNAYSSPGPSSPSENRCTSMWTVEAWQGRAFVNERGSTLVLASIFHLWALIGRSLHTRESRNTLIA